MDLSEIPQRIMYVIPLILSLSVHEWAHAWSAHKLGDNTAEQAGRLTLNPIVHIDPIGTLLLPMLGIPFGWAKPVPINPARFDRRFSMATGSALTAAAGPISNVLLAIVAAVVWGLGMRFFPEVATEKMVVSLVGMLILQNCGLAIFNMVPIPPLDGSRLLERWLVYRNRALWDTIERYAPILLLGVLVISFQFGILMPPIRFLAGLIGSLTRVIAGA